MKRRRKKETLNCDCVLLKTLEVMTTRPLQVLGGALGAMAPTDSLFQGANEGPAQTAAKLTGVQSIGQRADDASYFTNNEGIPFPDPAHSKTAGGIPVISDTFLLQKQQHFNRSKNLERMVHPCGFPLFFTGHWGNHSLICVCH